MDLPVEPCPALSAVERLDAELDRVLAVAAAELDGLPADAVIEFARRFERVRHRLSLVDHQIIHTLEVNEIPAQHCVRSTQRFLAQTLVLSPGEARQRVLAHGALHPRLTMVGEVLPPVRPVLAAAQRDGSVSPAQAQVIIAATDRLERLSHITAVTPELVAEAEADLTEFATTFDSRELRRCAERMVECVDPDGVLADERAQQALREVQLTVRKDGLYSLRGVLTPPAGAALSAVLLPLARRRPSSAAEGEIAGADDRDYPARLHDALEDATQRLLRSGTLPMSGGVPATVLITVSEAALRADCGFGRCSDGSLVPVRRLATWAGEAEVMTVSTTRSGEVLELGRQRRFASRHQILALIARDGACTFPGCDHPPQWCEHHHITEWQRGGNTDIANLTLLCRYHHHRFEAHGWNCRMIDGLPHWIPPRWADPEQRPILNRRLSDRHLESRGLADPEPTPPRSAFHLSGTDLSCTDLSHADVSHTEPAEKTSDSPFGPGPVPHLGSETGLWPEFVAGSGEVEAGPSSEAVAESSDPSHLELSHLKPSVSKSEVDVLDEWGDEWTEEWAEWAEEWAEWADDRLQPAGAAEPAGIRPERAAAEDH